MIMNVEAVHARYLARFGDLGDFGMPQILADPLFLGLLDGAVKRGRPLTEQEVHDAFPDEAWEVVEN